MMSQREDLLEAAIVCLNAQGYAKTTSRDITATAQVSSLAAIVYHFGSKDALLNEAIGEIGRRWIGRLEHLVASGDGGVGGLRAAAGEFYPTLQANRLALCGFIDALGQAQRFDEVRAQLAAHYQGFRSSLAAVAQQSTGERSRDRLDAVASVLVALVDGLLIQWLLDPVTALETDDLEHIVAGLITVLLPATAHGPEPTSEGANVDRV
jgi:AcrR family transcriptional regulator